MAKAELNVTYGTYWTSKGALDAYEQVNPTKRHSLHTGVGAEYVHILIEKGGIVIYIYRKDHGECISLDHVDMTDIVIEEGRAILVPKGESDVCK